MKIRLTGTRAECEHAADLLAEVFDVVELSDFYPNRGASVLGRLYAETRPPELDGPTPPPRPARRATGPGAARVVAR